MKMKNLIKKNIKIVSLSPNWVTGIIDAEGNFSITKKEKVQKMDIIQDLLLK